MNKLNFKGGARAPFKNSIKGGKVRLIGLSPVVRLPIGGLRRKGGETRG